MKARNVYFLPGGRIRFKVIAEQFLDTTPSGPNLAGGDSSVSDRKEGKVPYIVYVSINLTSSFSCMSCGKTALVNSFFKSYIRNLTYM